MEKKRKSSWKTYLGLILLGILIGASVTYFYLADNASYYKEARDYLCSMVNLQTNLTNQCNDILEGVTGYKIERTGYLDCS